MSVRHPDFTDIQSQTATKAVRWSLLLPAGLILLAGYCFLFFIKQTNGLVVDDAYIGFQHLKNWMAGAGFTFNAGTPPIEGVTNIAWMMVIWPFAGLFGIESAARYLGIAFAALAMALTIYLPTRLAGKQGVLIGAVAGLLLILSFDFTYFTLAGMETGLLAVLLLAMGYLVTRTPLSWGLVPLGLMAGFTHPEAAIIVPLYFIARGWGEPGDRRSVAARLLAYGLLAGGLLVIRFMWFGDLVPNTFHSKPNNIGNFISQMAGYATHGAANISPPFGNFPLGIVMVAGVLHLRQKSTAFASFAGIVVLTATAFALYSLADWTERGRYFAPYLPFAWILVIYGAKDILTRLWGGGKRALVLNTAIIAATALGLFLDAGIQFGKFKSYPGYVLAGKPLKPGAEWIAAELEPDAVIATRRIGIIGYLTDREVFDYTFGLADRDVARLISKAGVAFDDPGNPLLAALWQKRHPDYLLEDRSKINVIVAQAQGTSQSFELHGMAYCVIKSFPLAETEEWVLAGRINGRHPCLP